MRLICGPEKFSLPDAAGDALRVILYGQASQPGTAGAGAAAALRVLRARLEPAPRAWDLLSLALSVVTADFAGRRDHSSDGWCRQFELDVAVVDPEFWTGQAGAIEKALAFLTTDIWHVRFHYGGTLPAPPKKLLRPDQDCVVLLSGGLDSLVGAIDLVAEGRRPFAVSQIVRGDAKKQESFARIIGGLRHLQLNHNVNTPGTEETSQRARSLIFLTFGVLAATTLHRYREGGSIPLFVCENGFIAMNPPLTGGRLGSLSTRTAHPEFLARFQNVLEAADLRVKVVNPYCLTTKGEMLQRCRDQTILKAHAVQSTSCGRFQRFNYKHCGRCVPCQVRRAAFLAWDVADTTQYVYGPLGRDDTEHAGFDDVRSVAMAIAQVSTGGLGLDAWLGAALSYPLVDDKVQLKSLIDRGLEELAVLHRALGVK